jgi:CheY-specific phosphatase CheX
MNTAIVRPFMVATKRVFERMLDCPCRVGKPTVCRGLNPTEDSVRAIVEVSGTYQGYMVLNLPATIASVAATVLGASPEMEPAGQNAWAGDQIARLVKALMRRKSNSTPMKLVAHSSGESRFEESASCRQGAWLVVPMVGRYGKFSIALCVKPVQSIPAPPSPVAMAD